MSKLITFEQALREKIIRDGELINPNQLFTNIKENVVLIPEETGMEKDQVFKREVLKWFFSTDESGRPAIFGSATENMLSLSGKVGYENSIDIQNRICSHLYSSIDLRFECRSITAVDIDKLNKRSKPYELLIKNNNRSWVATKYAYPCNDVKAYGVRYLDYDTAYYCELFNVNGSSYCKSYGISPVLNIQQDKILVDIEGQDECGAWIIY